jgi:acetylornithine deacetylase/succinyl-diaminopimelate desuccinylase family protein
MSEELAELVKKHASEEEVVQICRDLVRAPSENPPGNEEEVAKVSAKLLSDLGLEAEFVEPLPGRVSTISSWGAGTGPTLLFNGHYDVVPVPDPDAWPHDPFEAAVVDGKLYGRGSSDMKAGIAACLAAVSTLQRAGLEPSGRLVMHFVADEEALGTHGTRWLVDNGYCKGADEALVGEPTGLNLVTAERGGLWFYVHTTGVSAHGATPQLGRNAIEHMAHVVRALQGMRWRKLHDTLGAPTINVGTIHGGSKANMVPDRCVIEVDRRCLPGETQEEILAEVEAVLDDVRADVPDLDARIEVFGWGEASQTPEGMRLVDLLGEAAARFEIESVELGYMGMTDARFMINQGDVPSIIFGPGDIRLAHTTGEHVMTAELVQATRAYAYAFARFLDAT